MSNNNPQQPPVDDELDDLLQEFLHEYEHGLEVAKSQGHNTEYHTFDSQVAFLEAIRTKYISRAEVEAAIKTHTHPDGTVYVSADYLRRELGLGGER